MHSIPDQETIDKLLERGITVYGTDINGNISVHSDGKTYQVETEKGGPID